MKNITKNEKGITLVETLAIIVILVIFTLIFFNVMTSGMNFSQKESTKATLQQQANYIFTLWREYHEAGNKYAVFLSDNQTTIIFEQYDTSVEANETLIRKDIVKDARFLFDVKVQNHIDMKEIYPQTHKNIEVFIEIFNVGPGTPSYQTETKFSRL